MTFPLLSSFLQFLRFSRSHHTIMARALVKLSVTTVVFFLLFLLSYSNPSTSPPLLFPPPHHGARPAMILPLLPSPKNTSRTFWNSCRHLQRLLLFPSERSHETLRRSHLQRVLHYAAMDRNTSAEIWAEDTGSTVTYVPCATCEQCGSHQDPKFQPNLSRTYQPVKCNLDCNCDNDRVQCIYERQYIEMSSSSGVLGEDMISFGNQSELLPQRVVFGCENEETGDLYSQCADGIMGLGRGDLSVVDQLVGKVVISDSFSLCYGGMDIGGGAMVLGGISAPSDMVFSYLDPVRSFGMTTVHITTLI